jgi:SEC-C motif-containing protein
MSQCLCGSSSSFDTCCGPYLNGASAPTAEALMRSRYSAFVKGDLDYIEKTCAGPARLTFDKAILSQTLLLTQWIDLLISDRTDGQVGDTTGYVTFTVRFRENGQLFSQTERSEFRRIGDEWRYWAGDYALNPKPASKGQVGRNDPCPCGSGKKFKKCCGA